MKRDQADPKILDYKATSHTLFIVQSTCLIIKSTVRRLHENGRRFRDSITISEVGREWKNIRDWVFKYCLLPTSTMLALDKLTLSPHNISLSGTSNVPSGHKPVGPNGRPLCRLTLDEWNRLPHGEVNTLFNKWKDSVTTKSTGHDISWTYEDVFGTHPLRVQQILYKGSLAK